MIQNILRHLGGIEQYGIVSLCLFCSIFTMVLIWAFIQRKSHLDLMARVPLENETENPRNRENSHE